MKEYTFEPDRASRNILDAFHREFAPRGEMRGDGSYPVLFAIIPTNLHNGVICSRADLCVDIDAGDKIRPNKDGTWTVRRHRPEPNKDELSFTWKEQVDGHVIARTYRHCSPKSSAFSDPRWAILLIRNEDTLDMWAVDFANLDLAKQEIARCYQETGEAWVDMTRDLVGSYKNVRRPRS